MRKIILMLLFFAPGLSAMEVGDTTWVVRKNPPSREVIRAFTGPFEVASSKPSHTRVNVSFAPLYRDKVTGLMASLPYQQVISSSDSSGWSIVYTTVDTIPIIYGTVGLYGAPVRILLDAEGNFHKIE